MVSSGVYSFNPTIDDIITDAWERCGKEPPDISSDNVRSAIYSLNMTLVSFSNKQLNLWTVEQGFLPLDSGQGTYNLPSGTIDLLEVTLRSQNRLVTGGGIAFSSAGGNADYAFDNDLTTACTQTSANGFISYDWGSGTVYAPQMVGIRSNAATTYTLVFEGSQDNSTWSNALTTAAATYAIGETKYYSIPAPANYRYFRVRETGGATLNVQEVYFNRMISDLLISRLSRSEYMALYNKGTIGRPLSYYVDRQISPTVTFWNVPNSTYNLVFYTRIRQMQDVTAANQTVDVPYRFIEAVTSDLAYRLATKFAPDRKADLGGDAEKAFEDAIREDRERVTFRFSPVIGFV